jgi:hypothetical protein
MLERSPSPARNSLFVNVCSCSHVWDLHLYDWSVCCRFLLAYLVAERASSRNTTSDGKCIWEPAALSWRRVHHNVRQSLSLAKVDHEVTEALQESITSLLGNRLSPDVKEPTLAKRLRESLTRMETFDVITASSSSDG